MHSTSMLNEKDLEDQIQSPIENDPERVESPSSIKSVNTFDRTPFDVENDAALERTRSSVSPPPDGGWEAWCTVVCAHFIIFNTWGAIQTFGSWQAYYTKHLPQSKSTISWIGSLQVFLTWSLGPLAGRGLDAGYHRYLYVCGFTLQLLGIFSASFATEYWQLLLAQGLCQGIGGGIIFTPTIALTSAYFSRFRSFAIGLVANGTSTGGLIYPLVVRSMISRYGFSWTMRTVGFITLGVGIFPILYLKPRTKPRKTGPIIEFRAFLEPAYSCYCAGSFLLFWAIFFPFYYIPSYAESTVHASPSTATLLLLVANVVGVIPRSTLNLLADHTLGPSTMILGCVLAVALVNILWIPLNSLRSPTPGLWAWAVCFGLMGASAMGLFPAALSTLTPDARRQGARMGMGFAVAGLAGMTGPVIGGAIVQSAGGSYVSAQVWSAASAFAGLGFLMWSRWLRVGWSFKDKV